MNEVKAHEFKHGICEINFDLGSEISDVKNFKIKHAGNIYYETINGENKLLLDEKNEVEYYNSIISWGGEPLIENNATSIIIDLRKSDLTEEFDPNKINDNNGNFGENLILKFSPISS